jgi:alkylation response protein AidB-like acyl-CoA dehydrogenase
MNLEFSEREKAFQLEVRDWLARNAPQMRGSGNLGGHGLGREALMKWEQKLASKGWLAVGWPSEYGGPGWTLTQRYIWDLELARANAPRTSIFGIGMCGPVLIEFGSEEQKAEHLPHIANGTRLWCQGFSEPGAGSDLASLSTRADRDGEEYVVNGQKIWTTGAHMSDWIMCLARTSKEERKQDGISFFLIDMKTPGIEVREIRSIDGEHHVNEVFFTDVRVPAANRVGGEGKAWTIAKFLLSHERAGNANVPIIQASIAKLKAAALQGPALAGDPQISRRIAEAEIDLIALEYSNLRALEQAESGKAPGPESSVLKVKGSELQQVLSELLVEMGGYASLPWLTDPIGIPIYAQAAPDYCIDRAVTIFSGSNEIQKNVLAKFALGL